MLRKRGLFAASATFLSTLVYASALAAQTAAPAAGPPPKRLDPKSFGVLDDTVTTVPAIAFYPDTNQGESAPYYTAVNNRGRYGANGVFTEFYAPIDLPGGAFIDYIGLNNNTDVAGAFIASLETRANDGSVISIASVTSTVHGWGTDFDAPPAFTWTGQSGGTLLLHVTQSANPSPEYFGWVEIWWRRSVKPAPATATFADVQPGDFGFQFIEALAASGVTGGCGGGNYCPNANVTRAQMAVFLAKALGLHWPGATPP